MIFNQETFWRIYETGREDDAWDLKQEIEFGDKKGFANFLKDVLAFSNFGGGYILLGVRDKDRAIEGVTEVIDPSSLGDKIERRLGFSIDVKVLYFIHRQNGSDIKLGIFQVPPSKTILLSDNTLHGSDGTVVLQQGVVYYRRNTRSITATAADLEIIQRRILERQSPNSVSIQNEASALTELSKLDRQGRFSYKAPELIAVLSNRYEVNAFELGRKLWEVWKFKSRRSKHEFGNLLGIPSEKIDAYFDGEEMLDLNKIMIATKLFDLPTDYFFRPTFNLQFPYWQDDIVKYAILSLVTPKSKIEQINNNGSFYTKVITGLARKICQLHELLFSNQGIEAFNLDEALKHRLAKPGLKSDLARQYYKLLEQYPSNEEDRTLLPEEKIVRMWFFATADYVARLIIEGVSRIDIKNPSNPLIKYRFEEDLKRGVVKSLRYDSVNLKMLSNDGH